MKAAEYLYTFIVFAVVAGASANAASAAKPAFGRLESELKLCQEAYTVLAQNAAGDSENTEEETEWVKAGDNSFSASFPFQPSYKNQNMGGVTEYVWEAESEDPLHMFKLSKTDFGGGVLNSENIDGFLFGVIESKSRQLRGEAVQKKRIQHDRYPGCSFKIEAPDADWDFMVRVDAGTVYTLSVCSMKGESEDGFKDKFFNSLTFR